MPAKKTIRLPKTGDKINKWIVITPGRPYCICQCECGVEKKVKTSHLVRKHSKGCRVCGSEKPWSDIGRQFAHVPKGVYKKIKTATADAIRRCTNKEDASYQSYGGRGIEVRFENETAFVTYLLTLPGHDDLSLLLDRSDNDGHYEVGNLRFVTMQESCRNQRHPGAPTIITKEQVLEAKSLRKKSTFWTYKKLGNRYGVSAGTVFLAVTGKTWKHLKEV